MRKFCFPQNIYQAARQSMYLLVILLHHHHHHRFEHKRKLGSIQCTDRKANQLWRATDGNNTVNGKIWDKYAFSFRFLE